MENYVVNANCVKNAFLHCMTTLLFNKCMHNLSTLVVLDTYEMVYDSKKVLYAKCLRRFAIT